MNFSKEKLFTKDIPIAVCKNHSCLSEMQAAHTHDFIEITYVLQGSCVQKIDKVEYVAKEGDLLFITLDQVHSFRVRENSKMRYFNVLIDPLSTEALSAVKALLKHICLLPLKIFSRLTPSTVFCLLTEMSG